MTTTTVTLTHGDEDRHRSHPGCTSRVTPAGNLVIVRGDDAIKTLYLAGDWASTVTTPGPPGVIDSDRPVNEDQMAEFAARWREQHPRFEVE